MANRLTFLTKQQLYLLASLTYIKELIRKAEDKTASVEELEELLDWLSSEEGLKHGAIVDEALGVDGSILKKGPDASGQRTWQHTDPPIDQLVDRLADRILGADQLRHFRQQAKVYDIQQSKRLNREGGSGLRLRREEAQAAWERAAEQKGRSIRWLQAVAAMILIACICGGLYRLIEGRQPAPVSTAHAVPKNLVQPGTDKAVLILDNGQQIELSNTANGTLADENGVHVNKVRGGQLVYAVSKEAAGDHQPHFNTMTTPRGGKYAVVLPDGTKVWLNAASSITYPTQFASATREVTMKGEAYFEVTKDSQRPFIVKTDHQMQVRVYGTHFNINDYTAEGVTKTTLLEGAVKVSSAKGDILLKPGQQSSMDSQGHLHLQKAIDLDEVMAWKQDLFYFKEQNIRSIMEEISLWYDVDVAYQGPVPDDHFSAVISRKNSIRQLLGILEATGKVHFTLSGKTITVTE